MGQAKRGVDDGSAGKIKSETHSDISCYDRQHYDFSEIKAAALAWFIQFAIRADLFDALAASEAPRSFEVEFSGQLEIAAKRSDLRNLIREKHILDEPALNSIGLSLYNFPTLSHFFVAPRKQAFLREVTVRELLEQVVRVRALVSEPPFSELGLAEDDPFTPALHMTPTQVEREAGIPESRISRERFLVADMAAPVTVLKAQFLRTLSRVKKQKLADYTHWGKYGVLPYIDLQDWERTSNRKIAASARANLFYGQSEHSVKTIEETTKPHACRLLDMGSPVSCDLKAEASEQFAQAIAVARDDSEFTKEEVSAATEALERWFPCSYPWNLPDLTRTARMLPESSEGISGFLSMLDASGDLALNIKERLAKLGPDDYGRGIVTAMKDIRNS